MQTSRGDTALLARYSIATRIGTFLGPVTVGAVWDLFGAWAAFACISMCGAGTIASTFKGTREPEQRSGPQDKPSLSMFLPRWQPHRQALLLAVIPAVAFILTASFLRNASGAIQSSIFVVYLDGIGVSGTLIGLLVAIAEVTGVLGSLVAAPMERQLGRSRLVIACIAVSIGAIAITPLIGQFLVLLIAACAVRGVAQGMSQPLMFSILSVEVPSGRLGASVGLRNAVVRFGSIVTPATMGVVAEIWGIEASFYVIGVTFLIGTASLALATRRIS